MLRGRTLTTISDILLISFGNKKPEQIHATLWNVNNVNILKISWAGIIESPEYGSHFIRSVPFFILILTFIVPDILSSIYAQVRDDSACLGRGINNLVLAIK